MSGEKEIGDERQTVKLAQRREGEKERQRKTRCAQCLCAVQWLQCQTVYAHLCVTQVFVPVAVPIPKQQCYLFNCGF